MGREKTQETKFTTQEVSQILDKEG